MAGLGRNLIVLGLILVAVGVLISFGSRLPFRIGRLPGDFLYRSRNTTFYFPLPTSIIASVVLSFVMWLLNRR